MVAQSTFFVFFHGNIETYARVERTVYNLLCYRTIVDSWPTCFHGNPHQHFPPMIILRSVPGVIVLICRLRVLIYLSL